MQREFAETVLRVLREWPSELERNALARLSAEAWAQGLRWLDTSGLALYLLDQVRRLGWEDTLPPDVKARLERNLKENRERAAWMFSEFKERNEDLSAAGVRFANVKGFTLTPRACPDAALRHQMDLDFLVHPEDVPLCRKIFARAGYALTGETSEALEFKTAATAVPRLAELYRVKRQRSAEVHFGADAGRLLERCVWRATGDFRFPELEERDAFLLQARHLFKHLRSEWMRVSWVLEFRRCVSSHGRDESFWRELRQRTEGDGETLIAVGAALALTAVAFGEFAPKEVMRWAESALTPEMRLWLERYGWDVLLTEFPGSKLYLLMPQAVGGRSELRKRLLPSSWPSGSLADAEGGGVRAKFQHARRWMGHTWHRLRFHARAGAAYLLEAPRWRRVIAPLRHSGGHVE